MPFRNKIWSLASTAIEFAIGIGTILLVTRIFNESETGLWFLFTAIFGISSALRDALIQPSLNKALATDVPDYGTVRVILICLISIELIIACVSISLSFILTTEISGILLFLPIYSFTNSLYRWNHFYFRSNLLSKRSFGLTALYLVLLIAFTGINHVFTISISGFILANAAAFLTSAVLMSREIPFLEIIKSKSDKSGITILKSIGAVSIFREGLSSISGRIGLFVTTGFLGLHQTALLGVCQRFAQITLLPNQSLQSILQTEIMRSTSRGNFTNLKAMVEKSLAVILAITIPPAIVFCSLSYYLLELIGGAGYGTGWYILIFYVVFATLITPVGAAFGSLVNAIGKPGYALRIVAINSITNILLTLIIVPQLGVSGVVLSMGLTEIFGFLWVSHLLNKMANISIRNTFKQIPEVYQSWVTKTKSVIKLKLI